MPSLQCVDETGGHATHRKGWKSFFKKKGTHIPEFKHVLCVDAEVFHFGLRWQTEKSRVKLYVYMQLKLFNENHKTYSICGKSHKVLGDGGFLLKHSTYWLMKTSVRMLIKLDFTHIFGLFKEPGFGWLSVGDGFLGGECLQTENWNRIEGNQNNSVSLFWSLYYCQSWQH